MRVIRDRDPKLGAVMLELEIGGSGAAELVKKPLPIDGVSKVVRTWLPRCGEAQERYFPIRSHTAHFVWVSTRLCCDEGRSGSSRVQDDGRIEGAVSDKKLLARHRMTRKKIPS